LVPDIAFIVISDAGLRKGRHLVVQNDLWSIGETMKRNAGLTYKIYYRDEMDIETINKSKVLIAGNAGIVNFGGVQSENVKNSLEIINKFDGPVIFFNCDVKGGFKNDKRDNFVKIERPIYYADPKGVHDPSKSQFEIIEDFVIDNAFEIGRTLLDHEFPVTKPQYDLVEGGSARTAYIKQLKKIVQMFDGRVLLYDKIAEKVDGVIKMKKKRTFRNYELSIVDSFGKYSLMMYEAKKDYFYPRVFEQMFSNSIVLFDKRLKQYECFMDDTNSYGNLEELVEMLKQPYSEQRVEEQHQKLLDFDFDEREQVTVNNILRVINQ
jgi:hypothetical protein